MFEPEADSKIINNEFLTQKTVATLLDKIFSLNKEENEIICKRQWFINFAIVYGKLLAINNLYLSNIVDFGQMWTYHKLIKTLYILFRGKLKQIKNQNVFKLCLYQWNRVWSSRRNVDRTCFINY